MAHAIRTASVAAGHPSPNAGHPQDNNMSSLNFIGGEKGGVGKSVAARVLAQYFLDKGLPFTGFDTDRSHTSFTRFYADYAAPVVVDSYEGLDLVVGAFEETLPDGQQSSVIVDLAAQTAAPLSRWVKDSDLIAVLSETGETTDNGTDASVVIAVQLHHIDLFDFSGANFHFTRLCSGYGARRQEQGECECGYARDEISGHA